MEERQDGLTYWTNTKSPTHLYACDYQSLETEIYLRENHFLDPAILALELGIPSHWIKAYQRRLGLRPLAGNGVKL